ncbi:MAG: hypothetical protein VKI83_05620 [Synechococcaceae cyanobacterium]|nr:hypothetical protein [Synechococcaceae cyanobacterium]
MSFTEIDDRDAEQLVGGAAVGVEFLRIGGQLNNQNACRPGWVSIRPVNLGAFALKRTIGTIQGLMMVAWPT